MHYTRHFYKKYSEIFYKSTELIGILTNVRSIPWVKKLEIGTE